MAALRPAFQGSNWQGLPGERDRVRIDEGVGFHVFERDRNVMRVITRLEQGDARCASLALSHLSLSLSLFG
jgi:hypothetical protein